MRRTNLILLALILFIAVAPLIFGSGGEFKGSDDQGTQAITAIAPGYQPWFKPLWTPPSDEVESLLFSLQAAIGAGLLGYYVGLRRGRRQAEERRRAGD